jgi:hypothetical protein
LREIPVTLGRAHGLDFEGDAIWCMFSADLQIQKLDMKTGKVLDVIQLSKEDPAPHGLCINEGKLYYCGLSPLLAKIVAARALAIFAESTFKVRQVCFTAEPYGRQDNGVAL